VYLMAFFGVLLLIITVEWVYSLNHKKKQILCQLLKLTVR